MRRSGKSKPVVWRRQARFMAEGVVGLTRDKTRKAWKAATAGCHRAEGHRLGDGAAAGRSDPLDRPDAGQGGGGKPAIGAARPRSASTRAAVGHILKIVAINTD